MQLTKFVVTTILTAAVTAIAGGTANAEAPVAQAAPFSLQGADHGVAFTISRSSDSEDVTVALDGGRFTATDTGYTVLDAAGARIGEIPFRATTSDGTVDLAATVDPTGTHLTAKPIDGWVSQRQVNIQMGAGIGGTVGFVIGSFLGLFGLIGMGVLAFVTIPVGMIAGGLIGAGIGGAIGGSLPASDELNLWQYHCGGPYDPRC
ncbi:hypothetical protein [Nocardia noduli]|uniref:hypothetical protein n=1 Tax=Nocardia noduli TaxID=2815722 RepID=UPI001C2267C0|nr:hypothetical protein [Nocardia noduli]